MKKLLALMAAVAATVGFSTSPAAADPEPICYTIAGRDVCLEQWDEEDPPCAVAVVLPPGNPLGAPPGTYCVVEYP